MFRKRVFISHSAKEPKTRIFLDGLFNKLIEDQTFDVLVDKKRLESGCNWRDEIYTWMGLCHSAVILFSKSAIKDSIWVSRETSILLWRLTLDPNFVVIPVYLEDISPEIVKQEMLFKDLNLTAIQGVSQKNIEDMMDEIKNSLISKLNSSDITTPLDEVANQIVEKLKDVNDKYIEKALDRLNFLFSWNEIPGNDNVRFIDFLKQNYRIDWVRTAKIEKIDDGKIIRVSEKKNNLSLRLNDEKTKVNLIIGDRRADEFIVKMEGSKLNIYRLEGNLQPWLPTEDSRDSRRLLALGMLHEGLEKFAVVMDELLNYMDYEKADLIFHLVEPSWVDLCAASWIPDCAMHEEIKRTVILNAAKKPFSAKMYVRRASCRPLKTCWNVYEFSGKIGAGGIDEIVAEIEEFLAIDLLTSSNYSDKAEKLQQLNNVLSIFRRNKVPLFVTLDYSKYIAKLLPELQKKLPEVTFFLLSKENDFPDIEDLEGVHYKFLEPPLEPGKEDLAIAQCDFVRNRLKPKTWI